MRIPTGMLVFNRFSNTKLRLIIYDTLSTSKGFLSIYILNPKKKIRLKKKLVNTALPCAIYFEILKQRVGREIGNQRWFINKWFEFFFYSTT